MLADLDPAVESVVGYTRYAIEGDPAHGATISIVDRGGREFRQVDLLRHILRMDFGAGAGQRDGNRRDNGEEKGFHRDSVKNTFATEGSSVKHG